MMRKVITFLVAFSLLLQHSGWAQGIGKAAGPVSVFAAGSERAFRPAHLRGLAWDRLSGDFKVLVDRGDTAVLTAGQAADAAHALIRYFREAVSMPGSVFWVNLRLGGEDEIIDQRLERTAIGRIMLEADLQLKKDLAALTDPATVSGRQYWEQMYAKAGELFGPDQDMEIPAVSRPWIVPGEIILGEDIRSAYIFKATLAVQLEPNYLKRPESLASAGVLAGDHRERMLNDFSAGLLRRLVLPQLVRKVNAAACYAPLRQVYYSLILARWYRQRFPEAAKVNDPSAGPAADWAKMDYFRAYCRSLQQGEYSRQETVRTANGLVVRQYVCGGLSLGMDEAGSLGSIDLSAAGDLFGKALDALPDCIAVRLPGPLKRKPAVPEETRLALQEVSAQLNRTLRSYASADGVSSKRAFKDYSREELERVWSQYRAFILKHIEAGVMPVLKDFRPFPALEQANRRFSENDFSWYGRETSLTNVPLLVLFDPLEKVGYSVPVDTMAFSEKDVFAYDLSDLLELVDRLPAPVAGRLQLRVGWGTNAGLRGFYLIEGDRLIEFKGYTLNRLKTDEVYRTDDPAMALTKEMGELEARCLKGLGFVDAFCSRELGRHSLGGKEFTLVQLRREGTLGGYGAGLARMLTIEDILVSSHADPLLARTQYTRSGREFGRQLAALHQRLWFNGQAEDGWYHDSWHHAGNVDYLGNIIDLIPYSFRSIAGEEFNPLNPLHVEMLRAWVAVDLERFFIGAPSAEDWVDWGFIGSTSDPQLKRAFLQGFVQGYLPGVADISVEEDDLALVHPGRLESLRSRVDRAFALRTMARGQQAYDLHQRMADAFTETFVARQKDMRRYGEASRQGLSADNIPPNGDASSIRSQQSRDGGQESLKSFIRFGPAGDPSLPEGSVKDRLEGMLKRISDITALIVPGGVDLSSREAEAILVQLDRGFEQLIRQQPLDSERFSACYAMCAAVLAEAVRGRVPQAHKAAAWRTHFRGSSARGGQMVAIVAAAAAGARSPAQLAALAEFIGSEYNDLYDLGLESQRWEHAGAFLAYLVQRRDKGFLDLFSQADDAGVWLNSDLRRALEQLFGLRHSNKNYRLKKKALSYILRIHQVEDISKKLAREPVSYKNIAAAVSAFVSDRTQAEPAGKTAGWLLEQLRAELIAVARRALLSELFNSRPGRLDIGELDWIDEHTLEQLAFVIAVWAQARKQEQFSLTDWISEVIERYLQLKDRQGLNTWLNREYRWNREDILELETGGYNPQFFAQGYAREYAVGGEQYHIAIDFDFFNQATAGEEVPSCFNPTSSVGGHMPLYHALEVTSGFLSISDAQGRRIADAVVLLEPQGLLVQQLYSRAEEDFDAQVFDYCASLLAEGLVPAVFWQSSSPGRQAAQASGLGGAQQGALSKDLRLDDERVHFDAAFYYSGMRAEFAYDYVLTREQAQDYRSPAALKTSVSPRPIAESLPQRRMSKHDKAAVTNALFSLGLKHIDLGPLLRSIEELVLDDPRGTRLEQAVAGLKAKEEGAPVTDEQRLMISRTVEEFKRDGGSGDTRVAAALKSLDQAKTIDERMASAHRLGELGASEAVVPLISILDKGTFMEAQVAAAALGMIGDRRAVVPLIRALGNVNPPVRKAAAMSLGQLKAEKALPDLVDLANDEYAGADAVQAMTMFFESEDDPREAFSHLRRLADAHDLPFGLFAWFMEAYLFEQPALLDAEERAWLADKSGMNEDAMATLLFLPQAREYIEAFEEENPLVYSGDRIWFSLRAARMLAEGVEDRRLWADLYRQAAELERARQSLPSVGTEIEVFESLIDDPGFDPRRGRSICAWLGMNIDNKDGLIEYAINPTSSYRLQKELKDFLVQANAIPSGVLPLHINLGLDAQQPVPEAQRSLVSQYIAFPLSLLYASDRRFIDEDQHNYFGPMVDVKSVTERNGFRIELRPFLMVTSEREEDSRGMFGQREQSFDAAVKAAVYAVAAWQAYALDPALRTPRQEELARAFVRYSIRLGSVYEEKEHSLVWHYASSHLEYDVLALFSTIVQNREARDKQAVVRTRRGAPALQRDLAASVEELIADVGASLQDPDSVVPEIVMVRPDYATGLLEDVLDKAERALGDVLALRPRVVEEWLKAMGMDLPAGERVGRLEVAFHDSGFYKHTFKVSAQSASGSRDFLLAVKTDTKAIAGIFEKGEREMLSALQGTRFVPALGGVASSETVLTGRSSAAVTSASLVAAEFIDGSTVFELSGKEEFDYPFGRDELSPGLTPEVSRACLCALVGIFLKLNSAALRSPADFVTAACRAPYDFYQKNIVIEEDTGRAVVVDLGKEKPYTGIMDYLALAIAFYVDYDSDHPAAAAEALSVLSEQWPHVDWDMVMRHMIEMLQVRLEQYEAHLIPVLFIGGTSAKDGIVAEEKDIADVIAVAQAFLARPKDAADKDGGKGGIDLRAAALHTAAQFLAGVPQRYPDADMGMIMRQLRAQEPEGIPAEAALREALISLTK